MNSKLNSNHKYILGGGISGLLFAFYNPDYIIISPDIGGKLANEYIAATVLVHDSPETRRLLYDLDIPLKLKTHVIKYCIDGKLKDSLTSNERNLIIAKKMGSNNNVNPSKDNTLSYNDSYIPILDIDYQMLISRLGKRVQRIEDKAIRITAEEIICEKSRYPYNQLISTIPAPIFWKLYRSEKDLGSTPVTFVVSKTNPLPYERSVWDLVYFADKQIPYSRVNSTEDGMYLYEFTGKYSKEEIQKILPDLKIVSCWQDNNGIVKSDLNNIPPPRGKISWQIRNMGS